MAASGRDLPFVQLMCSGRRRSGRGLGRTSIPAALRVGRPRHCVCGFRPHVDTCGRAAVRAAPRKWRKGHGQAAYGRPPHTASGADTGICRGPPARGRSGRGVCARLRSCQGEAAFRAGGDRCPGAARARGVLTQSALTTRDMNSSSVVAPYVHTVHRRPLPVVMPARSPVNGLSGHSDESEGTSWTRRKDLRRVARAARVRVRGRPHPATGACRCVRNAAGRSTGHRLDGHRQHPAPPAAPSAAGAHRGGTRPTGRTARQPRPRGRPKPLSPLPFDFLPFDFLSFGASAFGSGQLHGSMTVTPAPGAVPIAASASGAASRGMVEVTSRSGRSTPASTSRSICG